MVINTPNTTYIFPVVHKFSPGSAANNVAWNPNITTKNDNKFFKLNIAGIKFIIQILIPDI